ncbi:MAG: type II toxin-antitoxin system VapC family toxin [Azonexus sp.]|jgi:predicted nucleic-acid-binding protein|nr:type II toxin-antitoxin system VapC family toxin [Betaproteobacteria bacterium]MBK8919581.1 type II toxin-antitoxin system VapC family toxin [Betaproteobacteria bacterium]MBP6036348.1 type II toxin-antitoxin system VapC family toxin [Azonexus sp.]MBP6906788.1 type II toxin-antitoxin system VapC family toxin [Azonexus sp.]
MIGIDTNVLVRYLVRDDAVQFALARDLILGAVASGEAILISLPVVLETEWVLRSRYRRNKADVAGALADLLESRELSFEAEESLEEALYAWKGSTADFADCLIAAHQRRLGAKTTWTFDALAARLSGMSRLGSA